MPSSRTNALIARVKADHGLSVSEDQIRAGRRAGVVPRPPERVRGWRPGLAESIPAQEVDQLAEVMRRVSSGQTYAEVAVIFAGQATWQIDVAAVAASARVIAKPLIDRAERRGGAALYRAATRGRGRTPGKGLRKQLEERLGAEGDVADWIAPQSEPLERVLYSFNPRREQEQGRSLSFFETFAEGVAGRGGAAHLAEARPALAALPDDELIRHLQAAYALASRDALDAGAASEPSPKVVVALVLTLLSDPRFRGYIEIREHRGAAEPESMTATNPAAPELPALEPK